MDVRCAKVYLHEMPIVAETSDRGRHQGLHTFTVCLHDVGPPEQQVMFRSAPQLFEGHGNSANLFYMGKCDVPGSWVKRDDVRSVESLVAIIQFSNSMTHWFNFKRYLVTWLKKLGMPNETQDRIVRQSRVFTTRECEAMNLRYKSPVELDTEIKDKLERLREIAAKPKTREESQELLGLMGECVEWMEKNDLPDEICDLPPDELCDAVVEYSNSSRTTAPMLTDGLVTVDRHTVQLCDAQPDSSDGLALADRPSSSSSAPPADHDDPVDSCDELEKELVAYNNATQEDSGEFSRIARREHESAGLLLFKPDDSGELPVLTAHHPKQKKSADDVAEVVKERYQHKHGTDEPPNFKSAMLQIAGCYRELVDEGRLVQQDRLSRMILPALTEAYRKLFRRKAASISEELKKEIVKIVLNNKCKQCGKTFCPSDPMLYGCDARGNEVAASKKAYNTRDFCEQRCEDLYKIFRCKCGRPLQKGTLGWLNAKCSTCGPRKSLPMSFTEMNNLLSGVARNFDVKRFYPTFS